MAIEQNLRLPNHPNLFSEQIALFTPETLRIAPVTMFDPISCLQQLSKIEGFRVGAIDIGGSKIASQLFVVNDGQLSHLKSNVFTSHDGIGYFQYLKYLIDEYESHNIPIGISVPGVVNGTRLLASSNLPQFMSDFKIDYEGDFRTLSPFIRVVLNDSVSGVMGGVYKKALTDNRLPINTILINNGFSVGAAVYKNNIVYVSEPGHVRVIEQLNPLDQKKRCEPACGTNGTCIKKVAGVGAGIEDIWEQRTGMHLSGKEIGLLAESGHPLAIALFDTSAKLIGHVAYGLINVFGFEENSRLIDLVLRGGSFRLPGYLTTVSNTLVGSNIAIRGENEFSEDLNLLGVALSALVS